VEIRNCFCSQAERPKNLWPSQGSTSKRDIYWYGTYEEVPFDAKLFAKPEGIKIEEASK
jgi:hypothetical protein